MGSSPFTAALASVSQGDSWAISFHTAAASHHVLQRQALHSDSPLPIAVFGFQLPFYGLALKLPTPYL
jgi:hypothetical protein